MAAEGFAATSHPDDAAPAGESGRRQRRNLLGRLREIYEALQEGKYPNCASLAAQLGVSAKTVMRDIDFLRDRRRLPIEFDRQRNGYYFREAVERFPDVPVTEKELFALCVAQKAIEQYQGTALQRPLEAAFQKCLGQLDDEERYTLQDLDAAFSLRPFAPEDADLKLFELLTEAIRERRGVEFEYRKPGKRGSEVRLAYPYHVMHFNQRWYLLAFDCARRDLRKFVLARMRATRMTAERFKRPADFDASKFLDRSLGVMTGQGDYEVAIELDAWLTDILRGRRWHPTQVWMELPGGGSRLTMRLSCLEEIEQSVLSWGTRATVLKPEVLRERVAQVAGELVKKYCEEDGGLKVEDGRASGPELFRVAA
jgi:proteasome accessory factor B